MIDKAAIQRQTDDVEASSCVFVYGCMRVQSVGVMCVKYNVYSCEWEVYLWPDCMICIYIC